MRPRGIAATPSANEFVNIHRRIMMLEMVVDELSLVRDHVREVKDLLRQPSTIHTSLEQLGNKLETILNQVSVEQDFLRMRFDSMAEWLHRGAAGA